MQSGIRVATPPPRPLLVFDGDCNFCTLWVRRWQQMTGDSVDYLSARDPHIAVQFPEIPSRQFDTTVVLIETDGLVYSGAEAVFRTWAHNPNRQWPLRCYEKSPTLANLAEWAYRLVAENRTLFSRLTRWFCKRVGPEWPLVKPPIIASAAFPVVAAVGDFHEVVARLEAVPLCGSSQDGCLHEVAARFAVPQCGIRAASCRQLGAGTKMRP